jgi:hypothetical protein
VDKTLGGKQITLQSIKGQKEIESFYNNVFIIRGWQVESSGVNNGFLVTVYKKANQKISVSISQTKNLEETLTEEELKQLIESGKPLRHYIGYEVSGKLHIGQGLYTLMKIKDLQDAGVHTIVFVADWHAWLNKKLDGKLETATWIGKNYLIEAFKAGAVCVGADPEKIERAGR